MITIYIRWRQIDVGKIPDGFVFNKVDKIYKMSNGMYFCEESNKRLKPFYI